LLGFYKNILPVYRITPGIFFVLFNLESSEASHLDPVTFDKGGIHRLEDKADSELGRLLGDALSHGQIVDEFTLGRLLSLSPFPAGCSIA